MRGLKEQIGKRQPSIDPIEAFSGLAVVFCWREFHCQLAFSSPREETTSCNREQKCGRTIAHEDGKRREKKESNRKMIELLLWGEKVVVIMVVEEATFFFVVTRPVSYYHTW
jgi:hypothetical protein